MTAPVVSAALAHAIACRAKIALRAAESAGAALLRVRASGFATHKKGRSDLVTDADRAAETIILAELRFQFPHDAILAEESGGPDAVRALRDQLPDLPFCWVVDPLDGTTNFAHGRGDFAVSIGLLRHGEPCLGVVLAPQRRELFVGGWTAPATCNGQRLAVTDCEQLQDALVATGFPYDKHMQMPELLARLGAVLPAVRCLRRNGSAALDLCDLAAGRLDGFWEGGLAPWDTAAGQAIAEAAGARLTDGEGRRHTVVSALCIAAGPRLHPLLAERLLASQMPTQSGPADPV